MISRLLRRPGAERALERIEHPEAIGLAVALAALAAVGWLSSVFWLTVAIGIQLAVAGLGAVWILGPARLGLGFARYASLASASVALTLFGRLLVDRGGLLLSPIAAVLLWVVVWGELDADRRDRPGVLIDLALVGTVFAAAAGVQRLVPADAWPPGLVLIVLLTLVPALRAAEARGRSGVEAVGHTLLHLLAVAQVAAALALLQPPGVVGAALIALTFHAWGGAATALESGEPSWRIAIEFGALALMGLVLALLVQGM